MILKKKKNGLSVLNKNGKCVCRDGFTGKMQKCAVR